MSFYLIKTDIFLYIKLFFRIFLLSFEKERGKTLQKEERKTVVSRNGWLKTRSHKQARGFSHIKYCRVAPATHHSIKSSGKQDAYPENASVLRSIFVEMFAQASLMFLKKSLVLFERFFLGMFAPVSFCFLWLFSFLFLRKEKEKESNE